MKTTWKLAGTVKSDLRLARYSAQSTSFSDQTANQLRLTGVRLNHRNFPPPSKVRRAKSPVLLIAPMLMEQFFIQSANFCFQLSEIVESA